MAWLANLSFVVRHLPRYVHHTRTFNFDPNTFLLLVYQNDNHFTAHQDDRRHTKCVAVVCLYGSAKLCLSTHNGSKPFCSFNVRAGDVYALTGDALHTYFHSVEPCADFTGNRVAWTIRHTELRVRTQSDVVRRLPPPPSYASLPPAYDPVPPSGHQLVAPMSRNTNRPIAEAPSPKRRRSAYAYY